MLNRHVSATNGASGVPSVVLVGRGVNNDDSLSDKTPSTSAVGSMIASLAKSIEKHAQSLVDAAKMDAKEKEKERMHRDRERARERERQLRSDVRKLKGEKISLLIQHAEEMEKGRKVVADTIMDQVNDIELDIEHTTEQLESLQETLKKRKRNTPDSVNDS
jgi:hypothetical protein